MQMFKPQAPETKKTGAKKTGKVNIPDVSGILSILQETTALTPLSQYGDDAKFEMFVNDTNALTYPYMGTSHEGGAAWPWGGFGFNTKRKQLQEAYLMDAQRSESDYRKYYKHAKERQQREGGEWGWCCWCGNWSCNDSPRFWCKKG